MKTNLFLTFFALLLVLTACQSYDGINLSENDIYDDQTQEQYEDYGENPFVKVAEEPISTFAVDADGASYANMRRFLYLGTNPPVASVRIEEYINYFSFDYSEPLANETVGLNSELSTCPWAEDHHLIRIGMKGKTIPDAELPNSNFVFLIDVSGSMDSPDKLDILKSGFKMMTDELRNTDRVAIVTYAGSAEILLSSTFGDNKDDIKAAIDKLGPGGSTAGAEGIITAYDIALENFIPKGNNRVIIGSDGDFNVGPSSTEELVSLIEEKRDEGIYLTVLGVGTGNLNDQMMEQIANNGNGNYEYIDNAAQIKKVFIHEKSKFYTVAKDAKIQITFNPTRVEAYRLIGYENRRLENDEFENDTVDAGEIGSGQTITALYELVLQENNLNEEYAQFDFRYKKPDQEESTLITHKVEMQPVNMVSASENMRFAASIVSFGLLMKDSEYKGTITKDLVLEIGKNTNNFDPYGYRSEFFNLVKEYRE